MGTITGTSNNDTLNGTAGIDTIYGLAGDDALYGDAANDTLYGGDGNDTVRGGGGDDVIFGDDGNDTLLGGIGADAFDGGNGTDTVSYSSATVGLTIDLFDGSSSTGDAVGDTYAAIESFIGSGFNDVFIAGTSVTAFDGSAGTDDVIDFSRSTAGMTLTLTAAGQGSASGGGGIANGDSFTNAERAVGTAYNDIYVVAAGAAAFLITETTVGGTDEVRTTAASYTLGTNIENLTYTGTGAFTGNGNTGDNLIIGGTGADTLYGDAGIDTLYGGSNNDTIRGGGGDDVIFGEDGNDTLLGGIGGDAFDGGNGTDTVSYSSATIGLTIDLGGGSGSTGDAVGDTYAGIEGFLGSSFNDILIAGVSAIAFDGSGGSDTVSYASSAAGITLNLTTNNGTGDAAGDSYANIETLIGTGYADAIVGTAANETFIGGVGADTIDGGNGVDGASYIDSASGVSIDLANGTASGGSAAGDTLSNIENLYGSSYGDSLTGNAANNYIEGGAGADVIYGGNGNDTIYGFVQQGPSNSDVDEVHGGDGNDIVRLSTNDSNIAYGDAGNDDISVVYGTAYGGTGDDVIRSYSSDSHIYGEDGHDVLTITFDGYMYGGEGGDEYHYTSTTTAHILDAGTTGTDTVWVNFSLASASTSRSGDDLILSDGGTEVVLTDWFNGYDTIENFVSGDDILFHISSAGAIYL